MSLPPRRGPRLRLLCVNDVYLLDHLPRLRAFADAQRARGDADLTLTTLAGDFVAPSLLSSLDHGRAMVDALNAVPITHVCFGNHEQDVPYAELVARTQEFRGVWLNTNLRGFAHPLPATQVLTVSGPTTRAVRVGMLGVLGEDPALYPPGAFNNLPIAPANETALATARALVADDGCACVIAMTHQSLSRDRALALAQQDPPIPVIVGGHEHEPHVEALHGAWIVKAGLDATHVAVVDLEWPADAPTSGRDLPRVTVRLESLREVTPDPALAATVAKHQATVTALHGEVLRPLGPDDALSSECSRWQQTTMGALICSKVRDALGADVALLNGGGLRGNRRYEGAFTFGDLETELPFANEVVTVTMPGAAVRDAIEGSRAHAPSPAPGFLQVDDGVRVDAAGRVTHLANAPFDAARAYRVATVRVLFDGMDRIEALVRFARENPGRVPPRDAGRELKLIALEAFARDLWRTLPPFEAIDADGDGAVDRGELRRALATLLRRPTGAMMADEIVRALDRDGDGRITRDER